MLVAIEAARESVSLETYIYSVGPLGERFREALIKAQERGARVRVLIDALGSIGLPNTFWGPLRGVGAQVRIFNPLSLNRFGIRNHRKLLVCDERVAFGGGYNISSEYEGDGITCGWCDIGLKIEGPLVAELASTFDDMFARSEFQHKRFFQLRQFSAKKMVVAPHEQLLLSGPGRGRSPIKRALQRDLKSARKVQIIMAYFLPTWRIRRLMMRAANRGAQVQLILAGKSDVLVSQLAGLILYRRLLKGGIEI